MSRGSRRFLVFTALCLAAVPPALPAHAQSYFPGCPQWTHPVTFVNNCANSITVVETDSCYPTDSSQPPFNGGNCWPQQAPGGKLTLAANGGTQTVQILSCWSGNFGVSCTNCKVAISSLAEFTFDGGLDNSYNKLPGLLDTYDVSMVVGFVLPIEITPNPSVTQGGGNCALAGCSSSPECPDKLENGNGSCLSPCQFAVATGMDQEAQKKYCCKCSMTTAAACTENPNKPGAVPKGCRGEYGCSPFIPPGSFSPWSACCPWFDQPNMPCSASKAARAWEPFAQKYIANIHAACPNQYAWQFDDKAASMTCQGKNQPMAYTVTFCPGSPAAAGRKAR